MKRTSLFLIATLVGWATAHQWVQQMNLWEYHFSYEDLFHLNLRASAEAAAGTMY
jgi:hypothetical protein